MISNSPKRKRFESDANQNSGKGLNDARLGDDELSLAGEIKKKMVGKILKIIFIIAIKRKNTTIRERLTLSLPIFDIICLHRLILTNFVVLEISFVALIVIFFLFKLLH